MTDLRLCFRYELHVRRLSNVSPKYLTSFAECMTLLLNLIDGQTEFRRVKVTLVDLVYLFLFSINLTISLLYLINFAKILLRNYWLGNNLNVCKIKVMKINLKNST